MSSILTNTSSMVALQTLRSISNALDTTSNRVSTGLRVSSAADNAAYWSIATTTRSDTGALGAVRDALGLGAASVDTASKGLDFARESLQKVKEKLITAVAPEADRAKIQTEIRSLLDGIRTIADSSVSSGNNWLSVQTAGETKDIVSSFSRSDASVTLDTMSVNLDDFALYEAGTHTGIMDRMRTVPQYTVDLAFFPGSFDTLADEIKIKVELEDQAKTIIINRSTVGDVFGSGNAGMNLFKSFHYIPIYEYALQKAGIADLNFEMLDGGRARVKSDNFFRLSVENVVDTGSMQLQARDFGLLTPASGTEIGREIIPLQEIDVSLASTDEVLLYLDFVDNALQEMTVASTKAGALANRIGSQDDFVSGLIDANKRTIGTLVDADMEEESARLKALQVQRELAVQSLSIANAAGQNLLSLFRG